MNLWYTFLVAGLVLAIENAGGVLSDRTNDTVTMTAQDRRFGAIIRASSGLVMIAFAWLVIGTGLYQSGLKITFTST